MFLRGSQDDKNLAALNAPQRSLAAIGKCVAILALSIAMVVFIGGDRHVFGPPLIALLLTALVAIVLVSLRPRLFLAPFSGLEKDNLADRVSSDTAQSLFVAMPSPGLLVDCESRQVIAANAAAAALYGYPIEALPGLSIAVLWPATESRTEAMADGLAKHHRADGSVFWAQILLRRIDHGEHAAWLLAISDADERMNSSRLLNASERFAEDLLGLSPGIVFSHDLDGTLRRINPAFACALGYEQGELDGQKLSSLLVPHQHDAFTSYMSNIHPMQGGNGTVRVQGRDGSEKVWEFRNRLGVASDGSQSVLCCAIDISEGSRKERSLLGTGIYDPLGGYHNQRNLDICESDVEPLVN